MMQPCTQRHWFANDAPEQVWQQDYFCSLSVINSHHYGVIPTTVTTSTVSTSISNLFRIINDYADHLHKNFVVPEVAKVFTFWIPVKLGYLCKKTTKKSNTLINLKVRIPIVY